MSDKNTGYDLSRRWWNHAFETPGATASHSALYFLIIEWFNRLAWIEEIGLPSGELMEALKIKKHETYIKLFNDLAEWGFIEVRQRSKNQWTANRVALPKNGKAKGKAGVQALDKVIIKQAILQRESEGLREVETTDDGKGGIGKQETNNQELTTKNQETTITLPSLYDLEYFYKLNSEFRKIWNLNERAEKAINDFLIYRREHEEHGPLRSEGQLGAIIAEFRNRQYSTEQVEKTLQYTKTRGAKNVIFEEEKKGFKGANSDGGAAVAKLWED